VSVDRRARLRSRAPLSPLLIDWGQVSCDGGDKKSVSQQWLRKVVPAVPAARSQFRSGLRFLRRCPANFPVLTLAMLMASALLAGNSSAVAGAALNTGA